MRCIPATLRGTIFTSISLKLGCVFTSAAGQEEPLDGAVVSGSAKHRCGVVWVSVARKRILGTIEECSSP